MEIINKSYEFIVDNLCPSYGINWNSYGCPIEILWQSYRNPMGMQWQTNGNPMAILQYQCGEDGDDDDGDDEGTELSLTGQYFSVGVLRMFATVFGCV